MTRRSRGLRRLSFIIVIAAVPVFAARQRSAPRRSALAEHVVLVGIDGLSPEGIRRVDAPAFKELMKIGAQTLHARGVIPTVSSPNWASMLMAAGPEQHGVTSNDWEPNRFEIPPVAIGTGRTFPTIVGELRRARPNAAIGVFHDWDGFGRLVERNAATVIVDLDGPKETIERAVAWWATVERPTLTLIHLDHVDHAGHAQGWLSPEYLDAVAEADRLLRSVVVSLRARRLWDRTAIIVTADHGGVGKKHGGLTQAEIEIPWIAAGAGIAKGRELKQPVTTIDTAATIAFLLGVPPHPAWTGRPVREAIEAP